VLLTAAAGSFWVTFLNITMSAFDPNQANDKGNVH